MSAWFGGLRPANSGVDALTPSERRIAAMAAEGMTNREIAQALFVTLRTVEMDLSNAFLASAVPPDGNNGPRGERRPVPASPVHPT